MIDIPFLDILRDVVTFALALVAMFAAVYVARNKAIVENYKATVESQNERIESQGATIEALRERVAKLEGERDGYRDAMRVWVEAVADTGVCTRAWHCEQREIPRPDGSERRVQI